MTEREGREGREAGGGSRRNPKQYPTGGHTNREPGALSTREHVTGAPARLHPVKALGGQAGAWLSDQRTAVSAFGREDKRWAGVRGPEGAARPTSLSPGKSAINSQGSRCFAVTCPGLHIGGTPGSPPPRPRSVGGRRGRPGGPASSAGSARCPAPPPGVPLGGHSGQTVTLSGPGWYRYSCHHHEIPRDVRSGRVHRVARPLPTPQVSRHARRRERRR